MLPQVHGLFPRVPAGLLLMTAVTFGGRGREDAPEAQVRAEWPSTRRD